MNFHCTTLVFVDPDQIAPGIEKFFNDNPGIENVHSVSVFTTAVQKQPATALHVAGNQQPNVQFQFRFVVVYSVYIP